MPATYPASRYNVLGVGVHPLTLTQATTWLSGEARRGAHGYVCCCDVNSVSWAHRDPAHRQALRQASLVTPDGMPLVWLGREQTSTPLTRVYGPDLLLAVCAATAGTPLSHGFYGGAPGVAETLASVLRSRFPELRITSALTPPYHDLDSGEAHTLISRWEKERPSFIWVGLGTPKQERFMARFSPQLEGTFFLGVGAAFDFLTGRVPQAPKWAQAAGFEWAYRLWQEPRRLGPRYLRNNPLFGLRVALQKSGLRRYPL